MFSDRLIHMDVPVLANKQGLCSLLNLPVGMANRDGWWERERERERESGKPVLATRLEDNDDDGCFSQRFLGIKLPSKVDICSYLGKR